MLPILEAWRSTRLRAAELGRQLIADARKSEACQLLMSIPGVGTVTATSFTTAIEDPKNFKKSRSVGAWLVLKERLGFKRAAVAVARKLAVTMHAMLRSGEMFDRTAGATA
jgi:transposase